jgi:type IVB pilus formation R64 PilN family outer membrane protein
MMTFSHLRITAMAAAMILIQIVTACSSIDPKVRSLESSVTAEINKHQEKLAEPVPVISSSPGAWLAGNPVQIAEPVLPVLNLDISWHPTKAVSLADAATWIYKKTGLVVEFSDLQASTGVGAVMAAPTVPSSPLSSPATPQPNGTGSGGYSLPPQQNMYSMFINYEGKLSGLLDLLANKTNAWVKIVNGRAVIFRTETKTFYLPLLARKFTGNASITSVSSSTNNGSGSSSTGATASGGVTSVSDYLVDFWADLDKTAKTIAGPTAQVATNPAAGSVTVTGTPSQVRQVESWAKDYADQLSQQVELRVTVYSIKLTNEEYYNWNPSVVFKSTTGTTNYSITAPQSPSVVSGSTPFGLAVNVLNNATSGTSTPYSGSQLALQALSTLGKVVERINQSVVTLNGQPAPIQLFKQRGFIESATSTTTANVGTSNSITPGTVTTGFTAMFLPKIVNGKVVLGMTMTNTTNNGFTDKSSGGTTVQLKSIDGDSTQQSVSLTPGDALILTGLAQDSGSISKSGVGSAENFLFGGGIDNNYGKNVVAVVITARIL